MHNSCDVTGFTCPLGVMVMVNVLLGPEQEIPPFVKVGVTTIVAVIGFGVALVAVKERFPLPEATSPMAVLSLVQS